MEFGRGSSERRPKWFSWGLVPIAVGNGSPKKGMGLRTSSDLIGATTQAAVPQRAQYSASATCARASHDVRGLLAGPHSSWLGLRCYGQVVSRTRVGEWIRRVRGVRKRAPDVEGRRRVQVYIHRKRV